MEDTKGEEGALEEDLDLEIEGLGMTMVVDMIVR
ncbi:hypothetical protein Gotri_009734 [Gossypium trilobum]|uniref:Uncharacterized protein n=1 Tax=Gossypium trilobum TaxID=34281 RepID=A0A7J9END0_9ROSI|nr:hypothetical protein [Gossypium trilobum]